MREILKGAQFDPKKDRQLKATFDLADRRYLITRVVELLSQKQDSVTVVYCIKLLVMALVK